MTLRDLMTSDIEDVFLNTDEHAEEVTYVPADGSRRRTIRAICNLDSAIAEDGSTLGDRTQLEAFISRDQDNDTTGGVTKAMPGDQLIYTGDEELTFTWTGVQQEDDGQAARWLLFTRNVPYRIGGNR